MLTRILLQNLLYDHDASNRIAAGTYGSPFGAALNGACQTLVTFLIKRHDGDTNGYLGRNLGTPLHYCIKVRKYDDEDIVDLLLQYGADVNGLNSDGFGGYYGTPLNCASAVGSIGTMQKLLDAGADIHLRGNKEEFIAL